MSKQYRKEKKKKRRKTLELSHSKGTAFKVGPILPTPQKFTSSNLHPSPTVRNMFVLTQLFGYTFHFRWNNLTFLGCIPRKLSNSVLKPNEVLHLQNIQTDVIISQVLKGWVAAACCARFSFISHRWHASS